MITGIKRVIPQCLHPEQWAHEHCDCLPSVVSGPFTGMIYPNDEMRPYYSARLLGTYERELQPLIEELCLCNFKTVIDIGAAEGYYAVGFCKRCPQLHMIAFEAQSFKHKLLAEIAEANDVADRLTIKGSCSTEELKEAIQNQDNALIICDIEGGERDLLDPVQIPELKSHTLLVELHDIFPEFADAASVIKKRFEVSHDIQEIVGRNRGLEDLPFSVPPILRRYYEPRLLARMDEKRPQNMHWYFMKPRSKT